MYIHIYTGETMYKYIYIHTEENWVEFFVEVPLR